MTVKCSLGHENPDGSAFCDECGEPLASASVAPQAAAQPAPAPAPTPAAGEQVCPSCGATNPAGEAFCSNCGVSLLGAPAPAAEPAPQHVPTPEPVAEQDATIIPAPAAAPAAGALQARLIVEANNQEFDLSGKDNISIGREDAVSNIYPDVDLTPQGGEEGGVSRLHARIFYENGQYMLEDENSTNYTFLNRQRLVAKTPTPLNDNDEVKLGRVLLRFKTP
ncbi:FHA domain-containing protein [Ktedonosporobacter rubrisoli]|uniref:FHA domain-containing protein n=1 Tax=Ktedonosporobacter rubrisoli TaxID=2509675 RepID=A0A4V0YZR8_KTERU|nr:FHA domain-containing protein [Ktedonosporobacter rubrisoli]QBD80671.1 FHA domain-containing protein [Ktedonosporobacter rubrisoli]